MKRSKINTELRENRAAAKAKEKSLRAKPVQIPVVAKRIGELNALQRQIQRETYIPEFRRTELDHRLDGLELAFKRRK